MFGFIVRRLLAGIPVLFVVSLCAFFLIQSAHGDPAMAMYGSQLEKMRAEDQARIRTNLGLDQPIIVQYGKWLGGALRGELGRSYMDGRDVGEVIMSRLPNTLILNTAAMGLMLVLATVIGMTAAVRQYSWFDYISTFLAFLFYSIPSFWLALISILVFSVSLGWLPSAGISSIGGEGGLMDRLEHLVLPVFVLAVSHIGSYIRFVRSSLLEVLSQDYMLLARAKGLSSRQIYFTHAFRNALIPVVTYVGMSFASLIGGGYLIEAVFAYPGLGQLTIYSAATRDYPLLMGAVLLTGVFVVIGNLLADILCAWLDPRLKLEGSERRIAAHG